MKPPPNPRKPPSSLLTLTPEKLLNLPEEILSEIASYLIPLPPPNPPTITTLSHALSLSQTCQKLNRIVVARLHTLDFLTPASYTTCSSRTPPHASRQIDKVVLSAAPYVRVLKLPLGYSPGDGAYEVVASCERLTELSIPVDSPLEILADSLFEKLSMLKSLTLHRPTAQVLESLAKSALLLTEISLTSVRTTRSRYNGLSTFLSHKSHGLKALSVHLNCTREDNCDELREKPEDALRHLANVLQRHEIPSLQELRVSTTPEDPSKDIFDLSHGSGLYRKFGLFQRAIKTAREENSHSIGVKKLAICVDLVSANSCVAFMAPWINPDTEVEVSYPDMTIVFPGGWIPRATKAFIWFYPGYFIRAFRDIRLDVETLIMGDKRNGSLVYQTDGAFSSKIGDLLKTQKLKTLRIMYPLRNGAALRFTNKLLGVVSQYAPKFNMLELPADIVLFFAASEGKLGWKTDCIPSVKVIKMFDFQEGKVEMYDRTTLLDARPIRNASVLHWLGEKASRFLTGLPAFLRMTAKAFPNLELVYMEKTSVRSGWINPWALLKPLDAVSKFEETRGVDLSTVRTEIMSWRKQSGFR